MVVYKIDLLNYHQIDISIFSEIMACARSLMWCGYMLARSFARVSHSIALIERIFIEIHAKINSIPGD